ncbi:histone acetyltransferase type B subunit 2 [[Candida] jaroonii]|uniref:Histone acetyltransferase type B subunit 2 n=1 Tax=[Candida] jaroonii TaxID=467808 RepID=A0ACA9Y5F1_9ASCO|nr:histone acetyltransferase type B subunit 2 [[Candida] jaroonii]
MSIEQLQEEANTENTIKEEYKLWRENCRFMYEFVSETALKWPSITVQWLPEHISRPDENLIESQLLLGTHTEGSETNYLKLASTQLPIQKGKVNSKIKITKKFENNYEINRARYMPQDGNIVSTINGGGEIDIYKLDDEDKKSLFHLTHHTENGYGISWNPFKKGYLASGSDDKSVWIHEISDKVNKIMSFENHEDIVNDVQWHTVNENLLGSVSDDKYMNIYDIRISEKPVLQFYSPDSDGINSLAFSPFSQNLIAIGNGNSNISLIDFRKLSITPGSQGLLHTMMGHSDAITSLEFSPTKDGIVASGSQDRRLMIWDLSKIGEEQVQEDAEDGCPELFMMHAGHTGGVTDLSWCPYKDWTLASVADDNIVHIWEISGNLLNEGVPQEVDDNELE